MVFLLTNSSKIFRKRKKTPPPPPKSAEELQKMIAVIEAVHSDEERQTKANEDHDDDHQQETESAPWPLAASSSADSNATPTPVEPSMEQEEPTNEEKQQTSTAVSSEQRQDVDDNDKPSSPATTTTTTTATCDTACAESVAQAAAATAEYQATAKVAGVPTPTTAVPQQSSPLAWNGLWQRCVGDCCGAASPRSTALANVVDDILDEDDIMDHDDAVLELETASDVGDLEGGGSGFKRRLQSLLRCSNDEDLELVVPPLCQRLEAGSPKARTTALHQLMQLTDRERTHHRIPMVCTPHFDVISAICRCLQSPTITVKDRRTCLLTLANLTMPTDNKAVLLLGDDNARRDLLLHTVWDLLYNPKGETHLVCAILMNLSALRDEEGVGRLIRFVPKLEDPEQQSQGKQQPVSGDYATLPYYDATQQPQMDCTAQQHYSNNDEDCLENNKSLLRTLEMLMMTYRPFVAPELHSTYNDNMDSGDFVMNSMERECMRWIMEMMRWAVATHVESARLVGQTQIPLVALEVLRDTPQRDVALWKTHGQSLEDVCLALLVELALQEARLAVSQADLDEYSGGLEKSRNPKLLVAPALYDVSCRHYLRHIMGEGCIHDVRASAIICQYDPGFSAELRVASF